MMINTISLCSTCYKKIPASILFDDGKVYMTKECDVHGKSITLIERDASFVTSFYREGTLGMNNSVIVNSHDKCNMKCSWCYYAMGEEDILSPQYVNILLGQYKNHTIMLSGGEPTIDVDFFNKVEQYKNLGRNVSAITNMIKLADDDFLKRSLESPLLVGNVLNYACSFQHPKNYSEDIFNTKMKALLNMNKLGIKPACIMFSIQSLDELQWIKNFYDNTIGWYPMMRIRTMFRNWNAKGIPRELFLSDLYKEFGKVFQQYVPTQSMKHEHSNMYCLYMKMEGCQISLSSAPSVEEIDYHQCSRPAYMLAVDRKPYPVPIAQIVNEGIALGWKEGYRLVGKGGRVCGD